VAPRAFVVASAALSLTHTQLALITLRSGCGSRLVLSLSLADSVQSCEPKLCDENEASASRRAFVVTSRRKSTSTTPELVGSTATKPMDVPGT